MRGSLAELRGPQPRRGCSLSPGLPYSATLSGVQHKAAIVTTPKGLQPSAQGCRTRLPWVTWRTEDESVIFNLEEVAAYTAAYFSSS